MLKPTYETFSQLLDCIANDLLILSGEKAGDATWQDVAGTLATNMEVYAKLLHRARRGDSVYPAVFPSIVDAIEKENK